MSDPFSVTGSAVGVASLGLTICQGFLLYYGPYKSFHDDVDEVVSRIQSLDGLLTLLQKVVTESDAADTSPVTQSVDLATQRNIESCRQGLKRLQKMLDKCHRTCPPGREKASRLRTQVDRLLYPFRRETLMNLMDTVSWLQANVDTTLQVLHLSMLKSGQQSMGLLLSNTVSTASNTSRIIGGLERLEDQNTGIHSTLVMLMERMDQVESHIKASSGQPITKPKLLKSLLDTQRRNEHTVKVLLPKLQTRNSRTKRALRCNCDPVKANSSAHGTWCPLHNQSQDLTILLFRQTFCNLFLRFSVTASLTMTNGAGGFSISPKLHFRAVVPKDSPAFKLVDKYGRHHRFLHMENGEIRRTHEALFELFRAGRASPTDTLENGDTLLHAVAQWQRLNRFWDDDAWVDWHAFIDDLLATSISPSAVNQWDMTPTDVIFECSETIGYSDGGASRRIRTASFCLQFLKGGSHITDLALLGGYRLLPSWYSDIPLRISTQSIALLQSVVARHGMYDMEMPEELHPLILQSADGLHSLLNSSGPLSPETSSYFDCYAQWPEGLAILLDHGYTPTAQALGRALETGCVPCVKMMLDCDRFSLGKEALRYAGENHRGTPEIRRLLIEAFAGRRRCLQALAETRLPARSQGELNLQPGTLLNRNAAWASELLKLLSVDVSGIDAVESHCVYFTRSDGLGLWNELWDAGFRDVDEPDEDGHTVLMSCASFEDRYATLEVCLERAEWLVSRGAHLYRVYCSRPAIQHLAESMAHPMTETGADSLSNISEQCVKLLHTVVLDDTRDNCDCPCCAGGCFALKVLLHTIFDWLKWDETAPSTIEIYGPPLSVVLYVIESTLTANTEREFFDKLASRLIRYLTFCELDLTHTCDHDSEEPDTELITEIREEEASLLSQLEFVVGELLEEYHHSPLTLHQFLKEVWRERMDEILSELPNDQEVAQLRQVGVSVQTRECDVAWSDLLNGLESTILRPRCLRDRSYNAPSCSPISRSKFTDVS
ncbi:hypothetical protein BJX68DRAFT_260995 [Aspergillus pseudodeflectus]|uniref:Fungal N-terminal domain-containing protein n=1 Tax=Aspergillus pseudodeflectus TaxID=176178 RepID=A0ABR4L947_9EURO